MNPTSTIDNFQNHPHFTTKTGRCYATPDHLLLLNGDETTPIEGKAADQRMHRFYIIYSIIAISLLVISTINFLNGLVLFSVACGSIALLLLYQILSAYKFSATGILPREAIAKIEFKKGAKGATRSRFVVHFTNANGKRLKRMILLPGILNNGSEATAHALYTMRRAGYDLEE